MMSRSGSPMSAKSHPAHSSDGSAIRNGRPRLIYTLSRLPADISGLAVVTTVHFGSRQTKVWTRDEFVGLPRDGATGAHLLLSIAVWMLKWL